MTRISESWALRHGKSAVLRSLVIRKRNSHGGHGGHGWHGVAQLRVYGLSLWERGPGGRIGPHTNDSVGHAGRTDAPYLAMGIDDPYQVGHWRIGFECIGECRRGARGTGHGAMIGAHRNAPYAP